jgi:MADS-box transcription factor
MQGGSGGNEAGNGGLGGSTQPSGLAKRKSPDLEATGPDEAHDMASDPKRLKVDR